MAIFELYTRYLQQTAIDNTTANIQTSSNQISYFFGNNLRYPLPSDRSVPVGSPRYGLEITPAQLATLTAKYVSLGKIKAACYFSGANPPATETTITGGTNGVGGVCMIPSLRDADGDGFGDPILVGGIPIQSIKSSVQSGVSTNVVYDGWGSDLDYAVSANLANAATYKSTWGVITAHDEFGNNTAGITDDAHYAIISHGPDRIGSYTPGGQIFSICPFGTPNAGIDTQNCSNNSTYIEAISNSMVAGTNHFDDYVFFAKAGTAAFGPISRTATISITSIRAM